jgi:hypothetical protein
MNIVRCGQVWSSFDSLDLKGRQRFRIVKIDEENGIASILYEGKSRGKPGRYSLRTLRRGMRGCRIEQDADGTQAPEKKVKPRAGVLLDRRERSTASDHRRVTAPRGMTPREKAAWERGQSLGETE